MDTFYHNINWQPLNHLMPELVRSRYLALPLSGQTKIYRLTTRNWLLDVTITSDNAFWRLSPEAPWTPYRTGQVRIVKPNTYLEEKQGDARFTSGTLTYFKHGEAAGLDKLFLDNQSVIVLDYHEGIVERTKKIAILGSNYGEQARFEAQLLFYEILTYVNQIITRQRHLIETGTFADNVDHYLKKHLNILVTREQIARALHVSVSTLSHRYMAETGMSPLQKHQQLRLDQAAAILSTNTSIQNTAELLGFSSPSHLHKAFKKHFNMTVEQYRHLHPQDKI